MARKYKKNGVEVSTALNKSKKYKYDSTGDLVEFTGDPGVNEITLAGSKSSLRRMADMERNISILATTLTTTDDGVTDSDAASFSSNVNKKTRFKKEVRIDTTLNMRDTIDMNGDKITEVGTPTAATDAANKSYVDARETAAEATAAADATSKANAAQSAAEATAVAADAVVTTAFGNADATNLVTAASDASMKADVAEINAITTADADATAKANAAQSAAISSAATDATTKANAAQSAAISSAATDATTKANAAQAAAISAVTNGAGAAYDTLVEIQNAMATDAELSSAISSVTSSAASTAAADATSKANAAIASAAADATSKANAALASALAADSDTTYSVGDGGLSQINFTSADHTKLNGIAASANNYSLPASVIHQTELSSSVSSTSTTVAANSAAVKAAYDRSWPNTTYSVGDGGLSQINFTSADHTKLNGIATGATNVTNNNQLTNGAGYITGYTDTNTTYSAGNGLTLTGTAFTMSGSYTGSFTATGDITAYSDDSLKTNVQVIDGALGKVEAIRGVTFERIEDGSVSTGVIAQELKAVLPEAVHTDADGIHSVAYGNITGLLIEAVKELSAQVAELKAK